MMDCMCLCGALSCLSSLSEGCSNSAIDVVFLIDGSKSVRPENFELVKKWINQIVDKLDVSASKARVGLVQYSSSVRQVRMCAFDIQCYSIITVFSFTYLLSAGVSTGTLQQQEGREGCCQEDGLHGEGNNDRTGPPLSGRPQLQHCAGCSTRSPQGGDSLH